MTGHVLLDGAVLAVSFFNMTLLLWLGLTVLLNAERRAWGIWVATGGLLAGAAFLAIHAALYTGAWVRASLGLSLGWLAGWVLVLALPLTWYLNMLWYAGYWEEPPNALRRRQQPWLRLAVLGGLGLVSLLLFASPLPSYSRIVDYETAAAPSLGTVPLVILAYPLYILLCISLSLYALRRPAPSGRVMGDLARRRARPWLLATSLGLLAVSGLVAGIVTWLYLQLLPGAGPDRLSRLAVPIAWLDLITDAVLAGAILLLGQAVVSYEIFTGKALPRRGLRRHWLGVIALSAGLSLLIAASLTQLIRPINGLLAACGLVAFVFALQNRQSFVERERYMEHLRPFVANLRLYDNLLGHAGHEPPKSVPFPPAAASPRTSDNLLGHAGHEPPKSDPFPPAAASSRTSDNLLGHAGHEPPKSDPFPPAAASSRTSDNPPEIDLGTPFRGLCEDVLGARVAYLAALGRLAPLAGPPLSYPACALAPLAALPQLAPQLSATADLCVPIDPAAYAGASWAVPVFGEGELVGALLLGEKRDGGLYTQEEIEIARAGGERLIDTAASAEMARRLMALQRQRLSETQVLDQRARRILHDEILPRLHAALLGLSGGTPGEDPSTILAGVHRQIADLLHALPANAGPDLQRRGLAGALRQAVAREVASPFEDVCWEVEPGAEAAMLAIPPHAAEVVYYAAREAIRNAARHAHGSGLARPLRLRIAIGWHGGLRVVVEDNGVGVAGNHTASGGSGQGLALHSTMMAVIGGSLSVESRPDQYTRVTLFLPS